MNWRMPRRSVSAVAVFLAAIPWRHLWQFATITSVLVLVTQFLWYGLTVSRLTIIVFFSGATVWLWGGSRPAVVGRQFFSSSVTNASMNPEAYLEDILNRLEDITPVEEVVDGVIHLRSPSWCASREVEQLCDTALLEPVRDALSRKTSKKRLRHLFRILGYLSANLQDAEALELFVEQFGRKSLNDGDRVELTMVASSCRIAAAEPEITALLDTEHCHVLIEALNYCQQLQSSRHVSRISDLLDLDCKDLCHPMYAIWALESIRDPTAIPTLKRAIDRHQGGRKKIDKEIVGYAQNAINIILKRNER